MLMSAQRLTAIRGKSQELDLVLPELVHGAQRLTAIRGKSRH